MEDKAVRPISRLLAYEKNLNIQPMQTKLIVKKIYNLLHTRSKI